MGNRDGAISGNHWVIMSKTFFPMFTGKCTQDVDIYIYMYINSLTHQNYNIIMKYFSPIFDLIIINRNVNTRIMFFRVILGQRPNFLLVLAYTIYKVKQYSN